MKYLLFLSFSIILCTYLINASYYDNNIYGNSNKVITSSSSSSSNGSCTCDLSNVYSVSQTYNKTEVDNNLSLRLLATDQRYNDSSKADYQFKNNNFNGSGNFQTTGDIIINNNIIEEGTNNRLVFRGNKLYNETLYFDLNSENNVATFSSTSGVTSINMGTNLQMNSGFTLQTDNGSATKPAFNFNGVSDSNTGFYRPYSDSFGISTGGITQLIINNTNIDLINNNLVTTGNITINTLKNMRIPYIADNGKLVDNDDLYFTGSRLVLGNTSGAVSVLINGASASLYIGSLLARMSSNNATGSYDINYNTGATGGFTFYGGGTSSVWNIDNIGNMYVASNLKVNNKLNVTSNINTQSNFSVNNLQGITRNITIMKTAVTTCTMNFTGGILYQSDC